MLLEIHQLDTGQGPLSHSGEYFGQNDLPFPGGMIGLHVRRGRPEYQSSPRQGGPTEGNLLGLINKSLILLERAVVFLIEDDQPRRSNGKKQGGAGSDHHLRAGLGPDLFKYLLPAPGGLVAMIQFNIPVRKPIASHPVQLPGNGHFGCQKQCISPLLQTLPNQLQIDVGLAAAGHAVHKSHPRSILPKQRRNGVHGSPLFRTQRENFGRKCFLLFPQTDRPVELFFQNNQAPVLQGLEGSRDIFPQIPDQVGPVPIPMFEKIFKHGPLLVCSGTKRPGRVMGQPAGHGLTTGCAVQHNISCKPGFCQFSSFGFLHTQQVRRTESISRHRTGKKHIGSTQPFGQNLGKNFSDALHLTNGKFPNKSHIFI